MHKTVGRATIIGLLALATVAASGCSGISSVVAGNGTPPVKQLPPTPEVVTVSHAESVSPDSSSSLKEVSVTCQANEVAVGGGFQFEEGAENLYDPYLVESRPSGDGWIVGIRPEAGGISVLVTAYARCLAGGTGSVTVAQSASVDAAASGPGQTVTPQVTCPAGSTAVGGGFSIREGLDVVSVSSTGGGHFVNDSGHDVIGAATAFAVCYSASASVTIVRDHRVQSGGQLYSIYTASFSTSCPAGASMTAGGVEAPRHVGSLFINRPNPQAANWQVELLTKNVPVDVTGVSGELACVTFS